MSIKKIFSYTITCILIFSIFSFSFVIKAETLDEINKQLQDTNAQKTAREKDLANAKSLLSSLQNQSYSVSSDINTIKQQITDLENKINDVKTQVANLEKDVADTENELNFNKELRDKQIREYFINSYTNDPVELLLSESADLTNFQTLSEVQSYSMNNKKKDIDEISDKYQKLSDEKKQVDELKTSLDQQNNILAQKKSDLEGRLNAIANNINTTNAKASSIQSQLKDLNSSLSYLSARQKQLLEAEIAKMNAQQQTQQTPIQDGQYFFMGRGRDLIEGHGMGMSQWGMYGMALNYSWKYDQILTFYYPGTNIGDYQEPDQIVVDGKTNGPISYDNYLAGIGEVPNDWPTEAIKAQVVAARTYAMRSAKKGSDGYYHICGTDACQVYNGGTAKMPYVQATKGKVILYQGSPIVAYFSASHRGCSSTLSTVWGSSDLPYIKTVKDDQWAYKDYKSSNPYNPSQLITTYNWQWHTNGYSLDQLSDILSRNSATNVGKLQRIDTSKDVCGRVSKITIVGDKGTKSLTGWDFRAIFNDETPYNDYVYSTEFSFYKK